MSYYARIYGNKMQVLIEGQNGLRSQREALIGAQLLDFVYYNLKKLNKALDQAYSFAYHVKDPDFEWILKKLDMQNIYLRFFVELFLDTIINQSPGTKAGFEALSARYKQEILLLEQM